MIRHATSAMILGLAQLTLISGGVKPAHAGLIGLTVDAKFAAPTITSTQTDYGNKAVNPTAFFALSFAETATITNTQIIYTSPTGSGTYQSDPFNGYVFDFLNSGNIITSVTVDPSSTLSGFNPTFATLSSDGMGGQLVGVNLGQGLSFSPGATVVLDVVTPSSVPEPSSLLMLGLGVAGLTWRLRRRSRAQKRRQGRSALPP